MYPKQSKYLTKIYNRLDSRLYQIWFDHSEQLFWSANETKIKNENSNKYSNWPASLCCCVAVDSSRKRAQKRACVLIVDLDSLLATLACSMNTPQNEASLLWSIAARIELDRTLSSSNHSSFEHCAMRAINKSTAIKLSFPFRCCAATTTKSWRFKTRRVREKLSLNSLYEWYVNCMFFLLRSSTRSIAHL